MITRIPLVYLRFHTTLPHGTATAFLGPGQLEILLWKLMCHVELKPRS